MGADSFGIDRGFNSATIQPRFGGELAPIVVKPRSMPFDEGDHSAMEGTMIALDHGHDRAAIGPRSRGDRATIASRSGLAFRRHLLALPIRWRSDRPKRSTPRQGERTIADCRGRLMEIARSPCVHAVLPNRKIVKDCDHPMKPLPMKSDELATKIGRSWRLHVSSGKLSIKSLISSFCARVLMDDRVDSGPRDRRFVLGSDVCNRKIMWEHSPTRSKKTEMKRLNRGPR